MSSDKKKRYAAGLKETVARGVSKLSKILDVKKGIVHARFVGNKGTGPETYSSDRITEDFDTLFAWAEAIMHKLESQRREKAGDFEGSRADYAPLQRVVVGLADTLGLEKEVYLHARDKLPARDGGVVYGASEYEYDKDILYRQVRTIRMDRQVFAEALERERGRVAFLELLLGSKAPDKGSLAVSDDSRLISENERLAAENAVLRRKIEDYEGHNDPVWSAALQEVTVMDLDEFERQKFD